MLPAAAEDALTPYHAITALSLGVRPVPAACCSAFVTPLPPPPPPRFTSHW